MNKLLKSILGITMAASMVSVGSVSAAEIETFSEDLSVYYNGNDVYADSQYKPIIINDRTMVQIKPIFELMGFLSEYDETEQRAQFYKQNRAIAYTFHADDCNIYKTDYLSEHLTIPATMDVPAMLYNDTFYVPIRSFCEMLDMNIEWIDSERKVVIESSEEISLTKSSYDYSKHLGTWYYAGNSDDVDVQPLIITDNGNNSATIEWSYGETTQIKFISDNIAEGDNFEADTSVGRIIAKTQYIFEDGGTPEIKIQSVNADTGAVIAQPHSAYRSKSDFQVR